MTEQLRIIDGRITEDSEASKYFIVFCARKSDNPASKPGHAFVVWGKEDATAGMSSQISFGFYPKDGSAAEAILGKDVPGQILNEATKPIASSLLTSRIIIQVNKVNFDLSQRQIQKWSTGDYNLYANNCISFARSVAEDIGILGASSDVSQFPADYFTDFVANAKSTYFGNWQSNDPAHRFTLKIDGPTINWTELSSNGSLVRGVKASLNSTLQGIQMERQNTDEVLQFLGFTSATLRAEILSKNPDPSFILLRRKGETLTGEWHGLLVKKLPNGHLDQIIQPSQMPPKTFVFECA